MFKRKQSCNHKVIKKQGSGFICQRCKCQWKSGNGELYVMKFNPDTEEYYSWFLEDNVSA